MVNWGEPSEKKLTLKFDERLTREFKAACARRGVTMTHVIEVLMALLLSNTDEAKRLWDRITTKEGGK